MTCVVFTNNKEKAKEKLEEIKNIKGNLIDFRSTQNRIEYIFEDGEKWCWEIINENRRSIRAFKAYVDKDVTIDELSCIILPSCTHCKKELGYNDSYCQHCGTRHDGLPNKYRFVVTCKKCSRKQEDSLIDAVCTKFCNFCGSDQLEWNIKKMLK